MLSKRVNDLLHFWGYSPKLFVSRNLLLFFFVFIASLIACSSPEPVLESSNQTRHIEPAVITQVKESVEPVTVKEKTVSQGTRFYDSWSVEEDEVIFANAEEKVYKIPVSERVITREGKNRADFTIRKGDWVALSAPNLTRLYRYDGVETLRPVAHFFDGVRDISIPFIPIDVDLLSVLGSQPGRAKGYRVDTSNYRNLTWEHVKNLNPRAMFSQFADARSIGRGVLLFGDARFEFFIAGESTSPLAMDLNADSEINAGKSLIRTLKGEVVDLEKVRFIASGDKQTENKG